MAAVMVDDEDMVNYASSTTQRNNNIFGRAEDSKILFHTLYPAKSSSMISLDGVVNQYPPPSTTTMARSVTRFSRYEWRYECYLYVK